MERILCAANYYDDNAVHDYQPKNISSGFILCGHRHHNCISLFAQMFGFPYSESAMRLHLTEVQGFLTSQNRFVDRKLAATIAINAGQIKELQFTSDKLFSEDLY